MSNITRVDTDGVRSILDIGQLAVDNYVNGGDIGRIWTGNGSSNRALAFKDELPSVSSGMRSVLKNDLYNISPEYRGEIVFISDIETHTFFNETIQKWIYLSNNKIINRPGYGDGLPGTLVCDFEDSFEIPDYWESEWFGTPGSSGLWSVYSGSTPSTSTGPKSAFSGLNYIYFEASNGGHINDTSFRTSNFSKLTELSFNYHMYGNNIGTFEVVSISDGVEEVVFSRSGNQGNNWLNVTIDMSSKNTEIIEFRYYGNTNFNADLALDEIIITSI